MTDRPATPEPLSAQLGIFGKLDNLVYAVEVVAVVTALILMSVMVFTDVVYQLSIGLGQDLAKGDSGAFTIGGPILAFIGLMAFAATGDNRPTDERVGESLARPMPIRIGVTIGAVLGSVLFGWSLLHIESSTIYRVIAVAGAIPIARVLWGRQNMKVFVGFLAAIVLALVLFGQLPSGYSWSQSYSLILLLWVSFLGASVAARERRHLRVDLARKLMPPAKLPWFNMVSYLVAAAFTATVFYLGFIYMLGADSAYLRPIWNAPAWLPESMREMLMAEFPLPDDASVFRRAMQVLFAPSEPGELPDWLKVAAIPVSMFLICVRFLGHAIVFGRMGARGESYSEDLGVH